MRRMRRFICAITTSLALCAVCSYGADITVLNTRTSFTGATSSLTTINFEGIVAPTAAQNFLNPGLTTSGVNFFTSGTGPFGPGFVTVYGATLAGMQSSVLNTGTGAILVWGPPNQPGTAFLNAVLPPGTTAVGTDFWAQQPFISGVEVTAMTSDGDSEVATVNTVIRPTSSFIGFTSDVPITSVLFRPPAGQTGLVVDNFSFGQTITTPTPQVPEPPTVLLLTLSLPVLATIRKRIKQAT